MKKLRIAAFALLAWAASPHAEAPVPVTFTTIERTRILAHGPWPRAETRDPSNRVSGRLSASSISLSRNRADAWR